MGRGAGEGRRGSVAAIWNACGEHGDEPHQFLSLRKGWRFDRCPNCWTEALMCVPDSTHMLQLNQLLSEVRVGVIEGRVRPTRKFRIAHSTGYHWKFTRYAFLLTTLAKCGYCIYCNDGRTVVSVISSQLYCSQFDPEVKLLSSVECSTCGICFRSILTLTWLWYCWANDCH